MITIDGIEYESIACDVIEYPDILQRMLPLYACRILPAKGVPRWRTIAEFGLERDARQFAQAIEVLPDGARLVTQTAGAGVFKHLVFADPCGDIPAGEAFRPARVIEIFGARRVS